MCVVHTIRMLLHFVSLRDNKMFLHMSVNTKWEDILEECLHFQYCKKYAPERIVLTLPLRQSQLCPPVFRIAEGQPSNLLQGYDVVTAPAILTEDDYKKMVEEVDEIVLQFQDLFGKHDTRGGSYLELDDIDNVDNN